MKKLVVLTVMVLAGVAFASSLNVPWFVDTYDTNAAVHQYTNMGYPPVVSSTLGLGIMGLVYLHNNKAVPITCAIEYYTKDGDPLAIEGSNTFSIAANATIAFRPGADDTALEDGGQEAATGAAVPNRPKEAGLNMWQNANGAIVVKWEGTPTDVQGNYREMTCSWQSNGLNLLGFATLLPPGS